MVKDKKRTMDRRRINEKVRGEKLRIKEGKTEGEGNVGQRNKEEEVRTKKRNTQGGREGK